MNILKMNGSSMSFQCRMNISASANITFTQKNLNQSIKFNNYLKIFKNIK